MKALILAGGFGTRLRPLTYTRPKHILPIVNRPHIQHVFDLLQAHGIKEVVLLTSYLAEQFSETVEIAATRGLSVQVTHEKEPLGTAGALRNAEEFIDDEPFLAFNGDILTDVDLGEILRWHRSREALGTIVLTPVEDPTAYGVVPTDDDGRVLGFIEKPPAGTAPTNLINAGIYVFEPSVLEHIPKGEVWSAERQLFPGLVESGGGLFARGTDAYWIDIGTPAKYLEANLDALEGRWHPHDFKSQPVVYGEDVAVATDARVSCSCFGDGVKVGDGAVVDRCVLLPGAEVGDGAIVEGSILGERAVVSSGAHASGVTLGDDEVFEN